MTETGEQPQPRVEQNQNRENPDSLSYATREFFRDRESRNLTLKVLGPGVAGFVGAGLALFSGNPDLIVPSLLLGGAGTSGSLAYHILDRSIPIIESLRGKRKLFSDSEPLLTKDNEQPKNIPQ